MTAVVSTSRRSAQSTDDTSSPTLVQSPSSSACSSSTQHRLLYRGALSLPDSHMLLDGLTFFATTTNSPDKSDHLNLLDNPLALALETMRGRPSLRFLGFVRMKDIYVDCSGNVSVDIHPQALLSHVYFENVFCLSPLASPSQSERGVKVSLGDTDGPETTQIVIYAQVVPEGSGRSIRLCVGRITTAPPPPSVKRLPRPDDPTPRVPPFQLGKHPRVRELKRAHTSSELGGAAGKRHKGNGVAESAQKLFQVPAVPPSKTTTASATANLARAKGRTKKKVDDDAEDVFGLPGPSRGNASLALSSNPHIDPEVEKGNKVLIKQMAVQYLTIGLPTPAPGSLLADACGPSPPLPKTHSNFKDILGWIYRGVAYALRNKIKTTPLDPQVVDKLVRAHVLMYSGLDNLLTTSKTEGVGVVMREEV